jgi:hypothetical protein
MNGAETMKNPKTAAKGRRKKTPRTSTKAKHKAPKPKPNRLPALRSQDANAAQIFAQIALHPTLQAANTIQNYNKAMNGTQLNLEILVEELSKQIAAVSGGDLGRVEAMLLAQAHSLDAIYGNLARRAAVQEFLPQLDVLLRLALKAQSQCRTTVETLATIKTPPSVAFFRQANIAAGPQQVNNGVPGGESSRAREIENLPNGLLEVQYGERLDIGTTGAASGVNRHLAPLGKIERAANIERKNAGVEKR